MTGWRTIAEDRRVLFSPIGLLLVDDLTGKPPHGRIDATLEVQDAAEWRRIDRAPVVTASGVLIYPGLGRTTDVTPPPQHYRVQLASPLYRPLYRTTLDGIEFDAPPYNDTNLPAAVTARPTHTVLVPAANYPYSPFLAVLRGRVEDAGGNPVADVLVQEGLRERTLTDERGAFSLALRWVTPGVATLITAADQRNGRSGSISITLPAALEQGQTITIT